MAVSFYDALKFVVLAFSPSHPSRVHRHPKESRDCLFPAPLPADLLEDSDCVNANGPLENTACANAIRGSTATAPARLQRSLFWNFSRPANMPQKGGSSRTHVRCYQWSAFPIFVRCCLDVSKTTVGLRRWALRLFFSGSRLAGWACQQKSCVTSDWRAQNKDHPPTVFLRLVRCRAGGVEKYQGQLSPEGPQVWQAADIAASRALLSASLCNVARPTAAYCCRKTGLGTRSPRLVLSLWIRKAAQPGHLSFESVGVSFWHNLATSDCVCCLWDTWWPETTSQMAGRSLHSRQFQGKSSSARRRSLRIQLWSSAYSMPIAPLTPGTSSVPQKASKPAPCETAEPTRRVRISTNVHLNFET